MNKFVSVALLVAFLAYTASAATIWGIVNTNPNFTTLKTAVQAAGLVDVLNGPGTFTVFAPTNAAFSLLPHELLRFLLEPRHVEELKGVLLYHVLGSVVRSGNLRDGLKAPTVEGSSVTALVRSLPDGAVVSINQATVTTADVAADNGIVHIIDQVLIPDFYTLVKPNRTIVQLAVAAPQLTKLVAALTAAKLVDALNGPGPFTVFAPIDEAFLGRYAQLFDPKNIAILSPTLLYHVLDGAVYSNQIANGATATTKQGNKITIRETSLFEERALFVNNARVLIPDIPATNGVIHLVDRVILPNPAA